MIGRKKLAVILMTVTNALSSICNAGGDNLFPLIAMTVGRAFTSTGDLLFTITTDFKGTTRLLSCKQPAIEPTYEKSEVDVDEECRLSGLWLPEDPVTDPDDIALMDFFDNYSTLPKQDTCCFFSGTGGDVSSSDCGFSDEDDWSVSYDGYSKSDSDEEAYSDVKLMDTPANSLPVSHELRQLMLSKVKEGALSDEDSTTQEETVLMSGTEKTPHLSLTPPSEKKHKGTGSGKPPCHKICPHCQSICSSYGSLATHKSLYHSGEKICSNCKETLPNTYTLLLHKRKYHDKKQTCSDCQKVLSNTKALSDHRTYCHGVKKTCSECQKTLPSAKALACHKKHHHTGKKTCPECKKTFATMQTLRNHKRIYH